VYRYDFGDSWEHLVTVRESRPANGPLPRCTGGAGASPEEDSGRVWGWTETVRAGEVRDPQAFDLKATDRRLAALRG
jgi:hypothetical protein